MRTEFHGPGKAEDSRIKLLYNKCAADAIAETGREVNCHTRQIVSFTFDVALCSRVDRAKPLSTSKIPPVLRRRLSGCRLKELRIQRFKERLTSVGGRVTCDGLKFRSGVAPINLTIAIKAGAR